MLAAPSVVRNLAQLVEDGWQVLDSEEGHMACGEEGQGRLVDPERIVEVLASLS
jgi:phosphopantothenoylcysteine decarboxylase/phosphopantothenate--cysteine ligase